MKSVLFILLVFLFFNSCKLLKYDHRVPPQTLEEKSTPIIKDKIDSILTAQLGDSYIPYNYSILKINKPQPFLELDSIYLLRSKLTTKEENYERQLASYKREINRLKQEINNNKLYHTFEIEHIYIVKKDLSYRLYEEQFTFLPNYKLKVITPLLSTSLTNKEKKLFDYFTLERPLYETNDQVYDYNMNQLVYDKFNQALAIEKQNKSKLIHTILYCVEYIRENNDFNEQKIAEGIAEKWITENNFSDFKPKFSTLEVQKNNNEVSSFVLLSKNKNGNELITFIFDLNLVITNVTLQ